MSYGISLLEGGLKVIGEGFTGMNLTSKGWGVETTYKFMGGDLKVWKYSVYSKTPPVIFSLAWDGVNSITYSPFVTVKTGDLYEYYFIRDLYETNPNIKPYFYVYNTDVIANRSQYGIRVRDSNGNVVFHSDMTLLKPITGVTIGSVATDHYYDLKGSIAGKRIALNSCGGHMAAATDGHFISGFTTTYKIINSTIIRGKDFTIFRVAGSDDGVIRTFNDSFGSPDPNFRYMYLMAIDVTNIPF